MTLAREPSAQHRLMTTTYSLLRCFAPMKPTLTVSALVSVIPCQQMPSVSALPLIFYPTQKSQSHIAKPLDATHLPLVSLAREMGRPTRLLIPFMAAAPLPRRLDADAFQTQLSKHSAPDSGSQKPSAGGEEDSNVPQDALPR